MRFFSRYHIRRSVQAWFGIYTADIPPLIPVIPGINSLSGNSSVIRPLFFTRELHRLCVSVFSRAGEQSVTFGGKDEQRRNRATLFVKKAEQAFDSLLRLGAVDGTWTHTVSHTPLKRTRLPVPPQPQIFISAADCFCFQLRQLLYALLKSCPYPN